MAIRGIGTLHPTDGVPVEPNKLYQFLMQGGASAGQKLDWSTTDGTAAANAAAAGIGIVRISGMSTAGSAAFLFTVNLNCSGVNAPTSGDYGSSTNANHIVSGNNPQMFQVSGASTGFSVFAASSGWVMIEAWKK